MRKIYVYILFCLLINSAAQAQQYINFQGRIYQNSLPVTNSNASFRFAIPAMSWFRVYNNIPVYNGLYSINIEVPANLFDNTITQRTMTVQYNGNYIDTVTLYAPVERDPSVQRYIRDSVYWSYIRNKPSVIDTSNTNELQTIFKVGDSLKLSNGGGSVLIPRIPDTLRNTIINGTLTVFDTSRSVMITMPQSGTVVAGTINQVYWQSFKATANGKLRQLRLTVGASGTGNISISFYAGTGNTTSALAVKTFTITNAAIPQTFDISSLSGGQPFISVTNGEVYTFELKPALGNTLSALTNPANPYAGGISSISNTTDIPFVLTMDNSVPSCLTFDDNCRVGIGTDAPTAQLEVRGRIKDQTGFLMPVGTVIAYAGRNVPQGWLLCDGRSVSRTTYADLFEAIDTAWGSGSSLNTFNLPDMRGQFLRGVDTSANVGTTNADPDHGSRVASNLGGNTGNNVGSKQADELKSHSHATYGPYINISTSTGAGHFSIRNTTSSTSGAAGGNESRPKNVYVYYIIKY